VTEEWICPLCGFLNPHTIRVAFKDICVNCKSEKQTYAELEKEYDFKVADIDIELDTIREKAWGIRERISSLEDELAPLQQELKQLVIMSDELMSRRSQVQPPRQSVRITDTGKRVFPGQRGLFDK